jgi:FHS family L-fucose permease-like MFS transporter
MSAELKTLRPAFVAVTALFLAWGFITAMIDPLIPAMRTLFSLSYAESMLTQFAFFTAYGLISLPAAALIASRGFITGIMVALGAMFLGCLLMLLATRMQRYAVVLAALFVIASGITVLQVAANPLAAALGGASRSHFRLVLSQAFNSLGTVLAPYLGALFMLHGGVFSGGTTQTAEMRAASFHNVDRSFLLIAALIAVLALGIHLSRGFMAAAVPAPARQRSVLPALRSRWAVFGAAAIFLYVGAEVSVGSMMINYLHQPAILGVTLERAGKLLSLYWLGAMVGRFAGSALLVRVSAAPVTFAAALAAAMLCGTVIGTSGGSGAVAALAIGLFNSVMFPTVFTLTLERSSAGAAATSGLLCMAIVGGAVLPPAAGLIADHAGLRAAFAVPAAAYLGLAGFAHLAWRSPPLRTGAAEPGPPHELGSA